MNIAGAIRCFFVILLLSGVSGMSAHAGLVGSKHDFSLPGRSKAGGDPCVFCHAPHTDVPARPLWNRRFGAVVYTPYSSSSMQATPGQPTGSSKLCLSCHDGTIAVSEVASRPFPVGLFGRVKGRKNLGSDLSDDHPVSFVFDGTLSADDGELVHPATLTGVVQLDRMGEVQCTSCHDAHSDRFGDFLLVDGEFSTLCNTCHTKFDWNASSHANSPTPYLGGAVDPWPDTDWTTVAANGCSNCHTSHAAGNPETLLRFALEEDNCLVCHDGSLAEKDVAADIGKLYRHPVDSYFGIHDSQERFDTMPRHVECHDCHNPHATAAWNAAAPDAGGTLNGVRGVTLGGAPLDVARFEYEVCLRCHGDSPGQPSPHVERQHSEINLRLKISTGNPSFHPIAGQGRNLNVPSLRSPWLTSSVIYCTDCHASDGGSTNTAAGPHGSNWRFLLEREYTTVDGTPESQNAYDLCYKCHDRGSILNDDSFGDEHSRHIVDANTPCSVCHDPHGVSSAQANDITGSHLINFDESVVEPLSDGSMGFEDLGENTGRCYLICHAGPGREERIHDPSNPLLKPSEY